MRLLKPWFILLFLALAGTWSASAQSLPEGDAILAKMRSVNAYFMQKWPDPGKPIVTNRQRPSNIWTRGVYYEGLMALHRLDANPSYYDYAVRWGEAHKWGLRSGTR